MNPGQPRKGIILAGGSGACFYSAILFIKKKLQQPQSNDAMADMCFYDNQLLDTTAGGGGVGTTEQDEMVTVII